MSTLNLSIDIQQINAAAALPLWRAAKHASVFTNPLVLEALSHDVHWWLATESGRPACLWPICVDPRGEVFTPEFSYYVGPVDLMPEAASPRRRLLHTFSIHQRMLQVLTGNYHHLKWSTFPGRIDLRSMLWSESNGRDLTLKLRYTAVINRLQSASDENLLRGFGSERRNLVRQAQRSNTVQRCGVSLARIQELYCRTMALNGAEDLALRRLGEIEALYQIVLAGHGMFVACRYSDDENARFAALILIGKARAYEVLIASDQLWRERRLNPFSRLQAFVAARQAGCNEYDFNGANSLPRALDKHSYGSEPQLYFDITC